MDWVPARDVLTLTGIKNAKTLTRYQQLGIIAPPRIDVHPDGLGKMGYYPMHAVERIIRVRAFIRQGYRVEMAAALAREQEFSEAIDRDVTLPSGAVVKAADLFVDRVVALAAPILRDQGALSDLKAKVRQNNIYGETLIRIQNGENPILVVSETECTVTTDYGLAAGLSQVHIQPAARRALIVIPLYLALSEAAVAIGRRHASDVGIEPVSRVRVRGTRIAAEERDIEHEAVPDSYWRGFTIAVPVKKKNEADKQQRPRRGQPLRAQKTETKTSNDKSTRKRSRTQRRRSPSS